MVKARYDLTIAGDDKVVMLTDRGGEISLATDMARVVSELVRMDVPVDVFTIIYRDVDGYWHGVLTKKDAFNDFLNIGTQSAAVALKTMRNRKVTNQRGWDDNERSDGAFIRASNEATNDLRRSFVVVRGDGQSMDACPCCGAQIWTKEAAKRIADYCWPLLHV
jgi:hypothetical protein